MRTIAMRVAVAALLTIAVGSASAVNWKLLMSDDNADDYFDADSVTRSGRQVTVWTKAVFSDYQSDQGGARYRVMLAQSLLNCSERTLAMRSYSRYDSPESLKLVESQQFPTANYLSSPPGSVGDILLNAACKPAGTKRK